MLYLSLSWLLNWFPRPTVKLKFMAQCDDELYEGFDDRSKGFVGCGEFSISNAGRQVGIQCENGSTFVETQPDKRSGDPRHLLGQFDRVFSLSDFEANVFGVPMSLKRSSFGDAFRFASRNMMNLVNGRDTYVRKSFSYGGMAWANYAGILFYSSARINNEGEDWVYYNNRRKSDVGCSHEENLASNVPEQTSF